MSALCMCVCQKVCVLESVCASGLQEPVYQGWLTMDLWLWKRNPLNYEWGNPHLSPGNQGKILNSDAECECVGVCVCIHLRGHMHEQHRFPASPVQALCRDESSCQPAWPDRTDTTWAGETLWSSVGLSAEQVPLCWLAVENFSHGLQVQVGPTETSWSWKWRLGGAGWTTEAERGLHRSCPECWAPISANMNPMWKVYKSKVLKTLNPEYEEDNAEEVHN